MKKNFLLTFLILIFFVIFLIFYKGLQKSNTYEPKIGSNNSIPFLEFKIFNSENTIATQEIFKDDKFYLINIWASWCVPCREEHDFLINLNNETNLEIIGINYKDTIKNAQSFLNELGSPYNIVLSDRDGLISIEFGAYGVPENFLIYNKKIIKKIIGPINKNSLNEIKKIIK